MVTASIVDAIPWKYCTIRFKYLPTSRHIFTHF